MDSVELVILTALTYVLPPADFIHPRIGFNVALKVDVGALLDARTVARLIGAKLQCHDRNVYMSENEEEESDERNFITAFFVLNARENGKSTEKKTQHRAKTFSAFLAKKERRQSRDEEAPKKKQKKILIHYFTPQKVLSLNPFSLARSARLLCSSLKMQFKYSYVCLGARSACLSPSPLALRLMLFTSFSGARGGRHN
jgi:hypothetical protein